MPEQLIGKITHYFGKIGVGVIELTDGDLKVGDMIKIKHGEGEFEQVVSSMQVDHENVVNAVKGKEVGMKVDEKVKEGDEVYKVTEE